MVMVGIGIWLLAGLGVGLFIMVLAKAGRRDRLHRAQEACGYHDWVRDPRGAMVCRRCEWVAGQRAPVTGIEGCDGF